MRRLRGGAARAACGDLTDIQETSVLKRNHPEAGVGIIGLRTVAALPRAPGDHVGPCAVGACVGANARRAGGGGSTLAITINEGATASAVAGLGIAALSENSARAELEVGKLVRVLPDWDFGSMEVNALFANGKTLKVQ